MRGVTSLQNFTTFTGSGRITCSECILRLLFLNSSCSHDQQRWNSQSVPKRRHIKFRRWGITQKKEHTEVNLQTEMHTAGLLVTCLNVVYLKKNDQAFQP
jgi:hypothetical protein